ncbi:hypothetical protein GCK72_022552 [Caenorhabditis remanei]|uniref:Uncharacterized protein n=1 Tax=Caenorhabditis remanei TaxID=31234 RepID=A0A6A5FU06_CAERE|nr:hypothetical protein GCK72_022552 [Caenorhabditis remanei]KAF1746100.1 hypothetical protein GCK72_022552 [Caenorhabditis remanei]
MFLLFLLSPMVQSDPVHMHLKFDCPSDIGAWCGNLVVYEEDYIEHDIMKNESFCGDGGQEFRYEVNSTGLFRSSGDLSPKYEFTYQIKHNCTSGQEQYLCFKPKKAKDISVYEVGYVDFAADLFNTGTNVERCDDPTSWKSKIEYWKQIFSFE